MQPALKKLSLYLLCRGHRAAVKGEAVTRPRLGHKREEGGHHLAGCGQAARQGQLPWPEQASHACQQK